MNVIYFSNASYLLLSSYACKICEDKFGGRRLSFYG